MPAKKGRGGGGRGRQDSNDDFDWRKAGDKDDE
jgi:hypothetical protein